MLDHVSASSINLFLSCNRKWWYKYVALLEDRSSPAAEIGTAGHARIEAYYKTEGLLEPMDRVGVALLPGVVQGIEAPVSHLTLGGLPVHGKIDIVTNEGVLDWKYKSRLKDLPTNEELASVYSDFGRQMVIYAAEWFFSHPTAEVCKVVHIYMRYDGKPQADKRETFISKDELPSKLAYLAAVVDLMRRAALYEDPARLDGNLDSCYKYHRACSFMKTCPAQTGNRKENAMSLFNFADSAEPPVAILPPDVPPAPDLPPPGEGPVETPKRKKVKEPHVSTKQTFLYMYGAHPIGVDMGNFGAWLRTVEDRILKELGCTKDKDIRLADHELLKFGKWKATLGVVLSTSIDTPLAPGHYIVSPDEKEEAAALSLSKQENTVLVWGAR